MKMLCDKKEEILISTSQDQTIFIHDIVKTFNGIQLNPIGFIPTNGTIQQIECIEYTKETVNLHFFCFVLISNEFYAIKLMWTM